MHIVSVFYTRKFIVKLVAALFVILSPLPTFAETLVPKEIATYLEKISTINLMEQDQQEAPHIALLAEIETYWEANQNDANAWITVAVSRASYARTQGMTALGMMKQVRKELEMAIELDSTALNGYAHSFLGRLYFVLPGWPLSYGSDKKTKRHIDESLNINEQSMENQFSYANFLSNQKQYEQANCIL